MLYTGEADGLVADDLDRIARDPRDTEELIDVVEDIEDRRIPIATISGGVVMADDTGVLMARFKTAASNLESRNTRRRVKQGKEARARAGLPNIGGGLRPYGFEPGGLELIPEEAEEIQRAAQAVLNGATIHSVIVDLRAREVPTVLGGRWHRSSLAGTLRNPRVAGLAHYKGEIVGKAKWPAIISEEEWRAICIRLEERGSHYSSPGPARKYLGSGIYECGVCDNGNTMFGTVYQYRCSEVSHLARNRERVDELVTATVTGKLSRPEAASLLRPRSDTPDIRRMVAKAAELRAAREDLLDLISDRTYTAAQVRSRVKRIDRERKEIEADLDSIRYGDDPLSGIAGNPGAVYIWECRTLEQQRLILSRLIRVVILPARVPKFFSPADVRMVWLRSGLR
jgi:hypothetical protein